MTTTSATSRRYGSPITQAVIALVVGLVLGIAVSCIESGGNTLITWIEPIGLLWVNAICMTVIPLIVSSLVVAVSDTGARTMGQLGTRAFLKYRKYKV